MSLKPIQRRRAFTLVELMTVLVIVLVVLALAAPAIEKSRADARTIKCKNNLKQLGLAVMNYEETHKTFPPGWVHHHPQPGVELRVGWMTFILPFVDQAPLYRRLNSNKPDATDPAFMQTVIPVYRCPADPSDPINSLRGGLAISNYSGNFGPDSLPRWSLSGQDAGWLGAAPTPLMAGGIFWLNSRTRVRDIRDGTSNTLLISERGVDSAAGIWFGVRGNEFETDAVTSSSMGNEINTGLTSFSSSHGGGVNYLIGDGTVRFINEKIESGPFVLGQCKVFQALSGRNDGTPLPSY